MDTITMDWDMLSDISYQSQLGKSLKNTLRKFNREELFEEINLLIMHFVEISDKINHEHRVKSLQSCLLKYNKYYPSVKRRFAIRIGDGLKSPEIRMAATLLQPRDSRMPAEATLCRCLAWCLEILPDMRQGHDVKP